MSDNPNARGLNFTWADTISGYVTGFDAATRSFGLETSDKRQFTVITDDSTAGELLRNLGEPYADASGHLADTLVPGRYVSVYGIYYPGEELRFVAKHIELVGRGATDYNFEEPTWWTRQIDQLASFYRRAQFGTKKIDYKDYRTQLHLGGSKTDSHVQETDTISRMVYGMASAYMLTGRDDYLDVAEKGTEYLREHMRFVDRTNDVVYWYHGVQIEDGQVEKKLFTSEFSDDYDAIPMYEQIYALAGPLQTYRISGDPRILADTDATIRLFEKFFRDYDKGGYYSHVDPILLSPHHESIGVNASRKNWNSVGDHAPAYLVNLYLATGEQRHADMLERTFDTIAEHFPDYENSPFVNERFFQDWSHDLEHTWQQNRAVVGHNLKIAWNLMRMQSLKPKDNYVELAEKIADIMPAAGSDQQRGGWYDVVERVLIPGEDKFRFAWHDRKAWWQQEQAILAYLILAGSTGNSEYLRHAREAEAFYNSYFLDHDEGAVYFNVLSTGLPYLLGTERLKGSHSMSMYHSAELCYLAATYTNLLITKQPLPLWFKPRPDASRTLRVAPDLLPQGSIRLQEVEIDGKPYEIFDPIKMTIELPESSERLTVRAVVAPTDTGKGA